MGTTAKYGIEYLDPNSPPDLAGGTRNVAEGAEDAIAQATAHVPYAMSVGRVTITPKPNSVTSEHVDFPVGRFTVPPSVMVTSRSSVTGDHVKGVSASGVTSTGCDINIYRDNDVATGIDWVAVQMGEASAEG